MINRAVLIGRLTKDPELRYTQNGTAVVSFTLAVDRPFKSKDGGQDTDFIRVVAWRKLAELCAEYLKKGQQAAVDGRLQVRSFDNQEGQRITISEVVADNVRFLESSKGKASDETKKPSTNDIYGDPFANDGETIDIENLDLPF